jgi:hypothetical protein
MAKNKGAIPELKALGIVLAALKDLEPTQRSWVIASVVSNLGISAPLLAPASTAAAGTVGAQSVALPGAPGSNAHAKAFLRAKNPKSDVLRVACLAYYLTNFKETPAFKTKDITDMNRDAAGTSLSNPSQTVGNAYNQNHYLAPAGKGAKQITAFGEAVVDALPNMEDVAAVEADRPHRKKRKSRKPKSG